MKITIVDGASTYTRDATRQEIIDIAAMGDLEAIEAKAALPPEPVAETCEAPAEETVSIGPDFFRGKGSDTVPAEEPEQEDEPEAKGRRGRR